MFYIVIFFSLFIDLLTKYLAKICLLEKTNIFGNFLYLKYVENNGVAFSIQITGMFLKILTIGLITAIFYYYFTEERIKKNKIVDLAFGFILGGALGNGYERIFNSKVIDFIGMNYFSVFNLADVFITLGVGIFILNIIFNKTHAHEIGK